MLVLQKGLILPVPMYGGSYFFIQPRICELFFYFCPMISHEDFPFFAISYTKSDNISVYSIFKLSILRLTILTSLQSLPVHFLQENLSEAV